MPSFREQTATPSSGRSTTKVCGLKAVSAFAPAWRAGVCGNPTHFYLAFVPEDMVLFWHCVGGDIFLSYMSR